MGTEWERNVCVCVGVREGMLRILRGVADLPVVVYFSYTAVVLVCGFVTLLPLPSTLVGGYGQCIAAGLIMM